MPAGGLKYNKGRDITPHYCSESPRNTRLKQFAVTLLTQQHLMTVFSGVNFAPVHQAKCSGQAVGLGG